MRTLEAGEPITRRELMKLAVQAGATVPFMALNTGGGTVLAMNGETRDRLAPIIHWVFDGGISQAESWDPKSEGPDTIRGEFAPIRTSMTGVQFSEPFPAMARHMDKLTLIRSLRSPSEFHNLCSEPLLHSHDRKNYLGTRGPTRGASPLAYFEISFPGERVVGLRVTLPNHVRRDNDAAHQVPSRLAFTWNGGDFLLPAIGNVDTERTRQRQSLLAAIDRPSFSSRSVEAAQENTRLAFDILLQDLDRAAPDRRLRELFRMESPAHRAAYLALEFAKRGIPSFDIRSGHWDFHRDIFPLMREKTPEFDSAIAAQITAVERGLAPRSTVICGGGEFGRTPRVNYASGRDHWPIAHSAFFYGGKFPRGKVVGATNNRWEPQTRSIPIDTVKWMIKDGAGDALDVDERGRVPEGVFE